MKIVLTGGPSAGKTSAVEILHRNDESRIIVVQEAASILFRGGFPRQQEPDFIICQQKAIFFVQKELEEIASKLGHGRVIVCDRGSLDGLAYWPETKKSFFDELGSTMQEQINRYDWVIHLDTAGPSNYRSTKVRIEKNADALIINDKVKQAWSLHPKRIIIAHDDNFLKKLERVATTVNMILEGASPEKIQEALLI